MVQTLNRHATPLPDHSPHPSVHPVPLLVIPHRNLPLHSLGVNNRGHLKNWSPRFGNIPGGGCWCVRWYRGSVVGAGNATNAFTAVVVTVFCCGCHGGAVPRTYGLLATMCPVSGSEVSEKGPRPPRHSTIIFNDELTRIMREFYLFETGCHLPGCNTRLT